MFSFNKRLCQAAVVVCGVAMFGRLLMPPNVESRLGIDLVTEVKLAAKTEWHDWEECLGGSDVEIRTTESPKPLIGKFISVKNSDRRSGRLIIEQTDEGESPVPCPRIVLIRNLNTNVDFRVRFDGLKKRFILVANDAILRRASAQLNLTGHELVSEVGAKQHIASQRKIIHLVELEVEGSNLTGTKPSVREGDNAIWVTDLSRRDWKKFDSVVNNAANSIRSIFKQPNGLWTRQGKPIIVSLATEDAVEDFREKLSDRLKNSRLGMPPIAVMQASSEFNAEAARRLFLQAALAYESIIYSTKPLPAWLRLGMATTCRREFFGEANAYEKDKAETTQRLKIAGRLTETKDTHDIIRADEYIASAMVNELRYKDPASYSQLLIDLKHGEDFEKALENDFRFNSSSLLYLVGQAHGIDTRK